MRVFTLFTFYNFIETFKIEKLFISLLITENTTYCGLT